MCQEARSLASTIPHVAHFYYCCRPNSYCRLNSCCCCRPQGDDVVINLIPWNPIYQPEGPFFEAPRDGSVGTFQVGGRCRRWWG